MSDTRAFLLAHAAAYPALTLTDLFKALYQSAFGCEHLVADPSAAEAYIAAEAEGARPCGRESVEPLDGPYVRVHLDIGAHISKFINEVNSAFHYGTVAFHMGNNGIIAIADQCLYPFTDIRLLI